MIQHHDAEEDKDEDKDKFESEDLNMLYTGWVHPKTQFSILMCLMKQIEILYNCTSTVLYGIFQSKGTTKQDMRI